MASNINPVTKSEFDRQLKFMTVTLRDILNEFVKKKAWLDDQTGGTDAYLAMIGYSVDDIQTIREGVGAAAAVDQASLFFWSKHFIGSD